MTLRERIANRLTGGNYFKFEALARRAGHLDGELNRAERHLGIAEGALAHKDAQIEALNIALGEIVMCQTPGANATVKRMAKIAYDALYPDGVPT